ncbi:Oxoglutarate/iron-dependent dioxygenase [Penicillium griseofulvum]|uniref:Oxoglutarate/iron-dependent dioxygenase n=1 Tax=Penicillium patulum TaxID=5078 RepID=A0A135LU04_PENPA|nr:Oxoglutarate/iron-dependent dioxygenase [Penicillium griseofulvum]KXG52467.1 Oxoglutarate/iron-dependent dioxygenase [Penicillium griseofulvum]
MSSTESSEFSESSEFFDEESINYEVPSLEKLTFNEIVLVVDCDTASFGRGKEEVIDPQYRKAGKLEPQNFLTSFHPADFGILQNLEQILLPNFNTDKQNSLPFRKLSAELYKLNVYSAPSGLFRKHVDTPRCPSQIGSLVVCLPSHFKGGNLAVRHEGKQVDFDWSHQSASAIQWAAFYSDCEHEIETITEGDRITLTYNLYATEPAGGSIPPSLIVDPKIFPLYSFLKELIIQPGFMKKGGALGFYCSHAYPHASNEAEKLLPRALKGADLVLYSVFKSLGIYIEVLPVIPEGYYYRPNRSKVRIGDELCPFIITGTRDDTVDPVVL